MKDVILADKILTKRFRVKAIIITAYLKSLLPISSKKGTQKAIEFKKTRY